jgi:hypothetical protein
MSETYPFSIPDSIKNSVLQGMANSASLLVTLDQWDQDDGEPAMFGFFNCWRYRMESALKVLDAVVSRLDRDNYSNDIERDNWAAIRGAQYSLGLTLTQFEALLEWARLSWPHDPDIQRRVDELRARCEEMTGEADTGLTFETEQPDYVQEPTSKVREDRYVPEEFKESLDNPLYTFLKEKYGSSWKPDDANLPLFVDMVEGWFMTLEATIEAFASFVSTETTIVDSYPAIRRPLLFFSHAFEARKQDMIPLIEFMRETCRTDPTVARRLVRRVSIIATGAE